jgi:hypothetical protein
LRASFSAAIIACMDSLRQLRGRIETVLGEGGSLQDVERDVLARTDLPLEQRDAGWLYAWGRSEQGERAGPQTVDA